MRVITSVRIFYTAPNNGHVCGVELLGEVMGCVNANSHQYTVGDGYEFAGFISLTSQDADTAGNYLLLPLQYGILKSFNHQSLPPDVIITVKQDCQDHCKSDCHCLTKIMQILQIIKTVGDIS